MLAACAPTLDWREVRPEGSGLQLMLPCRPDVQARPVRLAGQSVPLTLSACSAGGVTWALAMADVVDPGRVGPALDELRLAAAANIGAVPGAPQSLIVSGATPNPGSARVALNGRLPDGQAVQTQFAVFTRGTWVFQATAVGEHLPADGVDVFFGALRFAP